MAEFIRDTDYVYISSYVRAKERSGLTRERRERMIAAPDPDEAAKVLLECGWPDLTGASDAQLGKALAARRQEVLTDIGSVCPEKALTDAFRLRYDYHNAKVLVKTDGRAGAGEELFSEAGTTSAAALGKAYAEDDWRAVPTALADAVREAKITLARTSNPQLTDFGLDRAYYAQLLALTGSLADDFCASWVRLSIDLANLRSAVRCVRGGLDEGVLKAALLPGGDIAPARVAAAAYGDGLMSVFGGSETAAAAALGQQAAEGGALADFEKECDNTLMRRLGRARLISFGPGVVLAYLMAMEAELTAVRMILLGKRSGVPADILRERLRDSYV